MSLAEWREQAHTRHDASREGRCLYYVWWMVLRFYSQSYSSDGTITKALEGLTTLAK